MDRIQRLVQGMQGGGQGGPPADTPQVDTAEQIYISSLALLKMLKHGGCRSGLVHLLALPGRQGGGASACRACSPPRPTPPLLLPLLERLSTRLPSPPALVASSGTPPPLAPRSVHPESPVILPPSVVGGVRRRSPPHPPADATVQNQPLPSLPTQKATIGHARAPPGISHQRRVAAPLPPGSHGRNALSQRGLQALALDCEDEYTVVLGGALATRLFAWGQ